MSTLQRFCILLLFSNIYCANTIIDYRITADDSNNYVNRIEEFLKEDNWISSTCKAQLEEYKKALLSKQVWALKMFDSGAKIPSGLFEGNLVDLGSFDQCLNIEEKINSIDISGKYCLGEFSMNLGFSSLDRHFFEERAGMAANLKVATCVPNSCSAGELEVLYQKIFLNIVFNENECQTKNNQPSLSAGSIVFLSFLGIILLIMIISTFYDAALVYLQKKEPVHPMLTAFSVITNGKKLFTVSTDSRQISCLHGIRVISTMWVIIGHRYQTQFSFPLKNRLYLMEWIDHKWSMFIQGGTLSVDTFFLLSGLTISYVYMHAAVKNVKFNIILYYVHRYLRLTPLLAIVVISYVTLLQHFGSGPLWPNAIRGMTKACEDNWWKTLLYIQNYGSIDMCVSQSWYLSVDTQLYILSPILLIPLLKWPGVILSLTGFLGICSILSCFFTPWFVEFNMSVVGNFDTEKIANYMKYYYFATYTRAAPWIIGILLGYILFQVKSRRRIVINKMIVLLSWVTSFAILVTCLYAGYSLNSKEYNKVAVASHLAFEKPVWALAIGWIIFACATGYGGPVNWFLSLPIFQVVSKFTYALYLVHLAIIYITTAQMRTAPIFSDAREMYVFWGDFVLTFAVSVIVTLAFESPIIAIEKWLLCPKKKKASSIETKQESGEA